MAQDDAIARLARQIDAARKSERFLLNADDAANLRRHGACELHKVCADFVSSVNSNLSEASLELSPAIYTPAMFREAGVNLFQISSEGRQMQIAFEATAKLISTEKFIVPYTLEGEVRTYNQKMLEKFDIRTQSLFFCVEGGTARWRFFEWRTRRTGAVDRMLLASLLEPLF